jgi:hypothetical protein
MNTKPEEDYRHWSVDKRVNISHLLTTLAMIVSLFAWGNKIDMRVSTLEANYRNTISNSEILNRRLERIEDKLDRIIERAVEAHK